MTVLLSPALLWRELQQPVHSRFHRAREGEMLYRLGVTECCSRAALSEVLRGFADNFARAAMLLSRNVLRPGPDRPNVPICRYGCRGVVIIASVPAGFGPGPKVVVEERAA